MGRSGQVGWRTAPAVVLGALFTIPAVVMVAGSLRRMGLPPPRTVELVPAEVSLGSYRAAVEIGGLGRALLNSIVVAGIAVPLAIVVGSTAGFAIARMGRRSATVLIVVSVVAAMIPQTALLVGRFGVFRSLGLTNTFVPLVAPALLGMSPLFVLVYTWAFRRIPGDLFDAASLEGLGPFGLWRRIGMPLVRPVTGAVAMLAFIASWGNVLDPLIFLSSRDKYTLPLALRELSHVPSTSLPAMLAGAVIATVPVVFVAAFAQRAIFGVFERSRVPGRRALRREGDR